MAVTTFAAIDIGSYNVSMEIFEIGKRAGLRSLTRVRTSLELGKDTFNLKKISLERLQELITILKDYKRMMAEYGVTAHRACAKSALREARNGALILESVYQATGIRIEVLSNSEQRFLGYKSIASRGTEFETFIEKGTAIVDLGGGSVQISLFDKDALVTTQNLQLGSLRIREKLADTERFARHYDELIEDLIGKDILNFKRMFLKDRRIENVILVGDYFTNLIFQNRSDASKIETRTEFMTWYEKVIRRSPREMAETMGIDEELSSVVIPSAVLYKSLIDALGAETIWLPGIQLTDGIAFDFAHRNKLIRSPHNFEQDILMASEHIAEHYMSDTVHTAKVSAIAMSIFEAVKKGSGLKAREALLLKVAAALHDCGKYISMSNVSECAAEIIRSTEIIGLSDGEREMIAEIVRYINLPFVYYNDLLTPERITVGQHMTVAKLSAILRIANALDESHHQKAEEVSVTRRDEDVTIQVMPREDFALETGCFEKTKAFFEEVFGLTVTLRLKRGKNR